MNYLEKYAYCPQAEEISKALELISKNIAEATSDDVLKKCFSMMDLTSLHNEDTEESVRKFVEKVNDFAVAYPAYPAPASLCVFPNFCGVVSKTKRNAELHTTAAAGCFPTSQSFIEVKALEVKMAVESGADEIDIVLALNSFLSGDYATASEEIRTIRKVIDQAAGSRKVVFKVILETGLLVTPELIAQASFLAMEAGADFIKTSTGKVSVNATPTAAYVMCQCIRKYYEATGRKVGFKPAGGMSTAEDAVCYYSIVSTVLGSEWLDKSLFRLGVSRMANNLLSAMEKKTVVFF